ncbi:hypothetical protein GCM10028806_55580 [Spirosoma terrae]|uniref:DUF1223 domain-containing protein n=1 Tax=Spirosoma terrae TaxID=1968276 RepID=A0A6L9LDZ3_9BACT|nr:DUF1223 domain-containing protein [Spirosoma terrae]NDU98765.1 DUF1223 domain-containing protein [Spirosoma terrae]
MSYQLTSALFILAFVGMSFVKTPAPTSLNSKREPVAVVELFTSQGCSSCPSADHLLTETLADAAKTNRNIIGLSFHVDYWDRLGWKDPFSNHAFTKRQYAYGEHFKLKGVYTPQEIVNGQQEFVGSNRARQSSLLETALSQPASAGVQLTVASPSANTRSVSYKLDGDLANAVLHVALVSKEAITNVQRGENAGRKLVHNNVVRSFQTVSASPEGSVTLTFPDGFEPANGAIVAYIQGQQRLDIRGASQITLN